MIRLKILKSDILEVEVDAIVVAANSLGIMGTGEAGNEDLLGKRL
jgi:O-acetyl-ADP-ribose deacetylase (regulator of RNase III)